MPRRNNGLRPDELVALCGADVVTIDELERSGVSRTTTRHRCRPGGPWRTLLPGIVLLSNAAPTRTHRRNAALLHGGTGTVLTGLDALDLHGMRRMPAPSGPVHVLIPAQRRRVGAGYVLAERTDRLPAAAAAGRMAIAPIQRAALDSPGAPPTARSFGRRSPRSCSAAAAPPPTSHQSSRPAAAEAARYRARS
ncbi:hypothetical protein [Pseudonocardia sp. TRM90224]|uniref:hypothetical protein n=1 Tax=Pseudonocardia sp. TRM90224 TaxID=2812678 RepID=UPI001E36E1F8|nr:hypothetical protein [Pseudonocardia sp. TRM90224]